MPTSPPAVRYSDQRRSVCARPVVYASATIPIRCSIIRDATSSATAPTAANVRAGPASSSGASTIAEPARARRGRAGEHERQVRVRGSFHAGTAVCDSSTAV